jgi:hypothetical protein
MITNEANISDSELITNKNKEDNFVLKNFSKMFPTKISFIVFLSYMALFINQGILLTLNTIRVNERQIFRNLSLLFYFCYS